jgi:hypothetical protein
VKNPPNTGLFRLIWPPGSRTTPKSKSGYPAPYLRSSTFHSFETPKEPKMLRAQNDLPEGASARYNSFPTRWHVQKLSIQEIEFHLAFLNLISQKVDLKVPFSFSKNSIIFNDLLEGASEHKFENFFCHQLFVNL